MLFNSFEFLVFFPVVAAILFALPQRFRKGWLLACSVYFYMSWSPVFILLILYSTTTDYFVAKRFETARSAATRKGWLILSLVTNFGALFFFKYYNFFIESWAAVRASVGLPTNVPLLGVVLPVGISFYTFEAISYTIDVYRGRIPAEKSYLRLLLFITFFPKLIAGPIERAGHLIPQFERETRLDRERLASGLRLMAWGFFKKLVIADRVAVYVNTVYAAPAEHHGATVLIAAYFFAFQIFCDFSAYTDIATGAARILGYDLLENFRRPYQARSIQDFWSRWHISLSSWFRDYLYIPLGGNRVSSARWCANLLIVFLVSGLWHGANWTYVVWGGLHGLYLVFSILTQPLRDRVWNAV
ncbi:MAG: MBOAT family protein, partial [Gemmatimonadetes bacterium]|nr:MBOAT family protein [Gemmatimonadota bacterium]